MTARLFAQLIAVVILASACASGTTTNAVENSSAVASVADNLSDRPESLAITDEVPEIPRDLADDEVLEDVDTNPCAAPALQGHFVDVELDDPDGGLNLRESPGAAQPIITTIERGSQLIPTGECDVAGSTDWWQVTNNDGSVIGWVSSRFLSDTAILSPGLGRSVPDLDNVGILAETIDGLAAQLAIIYGFGEDVDITQVGDLDGHDATSGIATYDLTGLRDDSSNGYRVEILFFIERDEANDGAVIGFSATSITQQSLCSRGVTDDGSCV